MAGRAIPTRLPQCPDLGLFGAINSWPNNLSFIHNDRQVIMPTILHQVPHYVSAAHAKARRPILLPLPLPLLLLSMSKVEMYEVPRSKTEIQTTNLSIDTDYQSIHQSIYALLS